jgi:muconolactone delta-isomerase
LGVRARALEAAGTWPALWRRERHWLTLRVDMQRTRTEAGHVIVE